MVINHIRYSEDNKRSSDKRRRLTTETGKINAISLRKEAPPSAVHTLGEPFFANIYQFSRNLLHKCYMGYIFS